MKKFVFILTLFMMSFAVFAETSSHDEALEELFKVINMSSLSGEIAEQAVNNQMRANPCMEPLKSTFLEFYLKVLGWDSIKPEILSRYKDAFTEEQVRDITAFYKTPTGQLAIKKMPVLMQQSAQIGIQAVQNNSEMLKSMINEGVAGMSQAEIDSLPSECRQMYQKRS